MDRLWIAVEGHVKNRLHLGRQEKLPCGIHGKGILGHSSDPLAGQHQLLLGRIDHAFNRRVRELVSLRQLKPNPAPVVAERIVGAGK